MTTVEPTDPDGPADQDGGADPAAGSGAEGDGAAGDGAEGLHGSSRWSPPLPEGRLARAAVLVARYVRSAPGNFIWLFILGINTFALVRVPPLLLISISTNLDELSRHPVKVLVASAFWTATPSFVLWFLIFNVFSVPVERWLGTLRWLAVIALAHILATLISEGAVAYLIDAGDLPYRTTHTIDIGVSYALSGAVGVLTWALARPLRWYYLGVATLFYALLLSFGTNFTNLGHLSAFLIGVGCYPITRGVPGGNRRPGARLVKRLVFRLRG
ncbi:hypothetical protein GXW82_38545 [Streptacidiphilus sp. 4-A2]|nr:hypothetical protein [Streptacidiphilus sp. 4-A2]